MEYARSGGDARVERHLTTCPLCTAQVAALQSAVSPVRVLITSLGDTLTGSLAAMGSLAASVHAQLDLVLDLAVGLLNQHWALQLEGGRRTTTSDTDLLTELAKLSPTQRNGGSAAWPT